MRSAPASIRRWPLPCGAWWNECVWTGIVCIKVSVVTCCSMLLLLGTPFSRAEEKDELSRPCIVSTEEMDELSRLCSASSPIVPSAGLPLWRTIQVLSEATQL
eukprot:scaffold305249_cov36-Tisochrysis_lutea.AAC.2